MKRKLLTVLLAVVMVFGVFGLTACSGSNADADYNYYTSKYGIEVEDVKIEAVTFQAVYKMFTTAGSFLLYVDSEQGDKAAERFAKINEVANEWNVTIYHFNPDLSGGYKAEGNPSANIITDGIKGAHLKFVQSTLSQISKVEATKWADNSLLAVKGAESTVSGSAVSYKGSIAKSVAYDKAEEAIAAIATKQPSYGAYTEEEKDIPYVAAAYHTGNINTMNLFGDIRLHMYTDAEGNEIDALTAEKVDVFVTVANYAMFADLLDNNQGYFAVFFGGTWCPNTQAIVYHVNQLAKDYGIEKVYFFDPRLDDGVRLDAVSGSEIVENKTNGTGNLNTRDNDVDAKWATKTDAQKAAAYATQAQADIAALKVTTTVENAGFLPTVTSTAKYSPSEISTVVNDAKAAAKAAELAKITAAQKAAVKAKYTKEAYEALSAAQIEKLEIAEAGLDVTTAENNAIVKAIAAMDAADSVTEDSIKANAKAANDEAYFGYQHLYGAFLGEYLDTYWSEWNITAQLTIGGEIRTRMCVPNMMMFNGEGEGKAELIALAEAEYTWANTSVEGNPQKEAWEAAVKVVFDANPYATYAPVVVVEESTDSAAGSGSSAGGSSAGAGDSGAC